jgi:hypothetical protein
VTLTWTTESEVENQGFILERRLTGETSLQELSSFADNPQLLGQGSTTARNTYTYTDKAVTTGQTYVYLLSDVDYSGRINKHGAISVTVKTAEEDLKPTDMVLHAAYPNPFNPEVTLSFSLSEATGVALEIYDLQGVLVSSVATGRQSAGTHACSWNGLDAAGNPVSSGIYLVRLSAGNRTQMQRVTLLR